MTRGLVVDLFAGGICERCEAPFERRRPWQRFCTKECNQRRRFPGAKVRNCRACDQPFTRAGRGDSNRWHCSRECARKSARRARLLFKKLRPERVVAHRQTQQAKRERDTHLQRIWKRYPFMPRACEACGEARVLDIAHRPEHRRWGAWRSAKENTPETIWILCPTCHALLDRLGYSPERLGIKERVCVAS